MASHSSAGSSDLGAGLRQALPGVDGSTMDELLLCLGRLGVTSMADLEYVRPESITPPLTEVQSRKLLKSFSGDVTEREKYKLELRGQDLKFMELQKGIEADKMKYKGEMAKARADIQKAIADQNAEIHNKAVTATDSEETTVIVGGSSYCAGLGAMIGVVGGPLGMAAGAAIGATVGAGLFGIVSAETRDARVEKKKEVYNQQAAEGKERLLEMDRDLERKNEECKLQDVNRAMIQFNNS